MAVSAHTRAEVISPLRLLQRLFDKFFVEVLAMTPCVGREARPHDEVKATKTMIERTERQLAASLDLHQFRRLGGGAHMSCGGGLR